MERLRDELASGEPLAAGERRVLEETLEEVAALLDRADAEDADSKLVAQLREAATRFEDSHPKLTLAIGAVADSLARVGL